MLPFFSFLIALTAFAGGFWGFSQARRAQEREARNMMPVAPNSAVAPTPTGAAPNAAPNNAPGDPNAPAVDVPPSPARPEDNVGTGLADPNATGVTATDQNAPGGNATDADATDATDNAVPTPTPEIGRAHV